MLVIFIPFLNLTHSPLHFYTYHWFLVIRGVGFVFKKVLALREHWPFGDVSWQGP